MVQPCPGRALARLVTLVLLVIAASAALTAVPTSQASAATFSDVVLQEAARHQGKPYRYGSTGPDTFDCSGFTGYVYGRLGVPLPRTSREQYAALPKVAQADKQKGDLVFTYDGGGIYHVGIYAGNNQMWAAPKAGDHVRLQTIWTSSHKVARPVTAAIQKHWIAHGGRPGFLGAARTGEAGTPDGRGAFTHYQGGSIYRSAATPTREVHGGIRDTWSRLGWEGSALGYPTTDERLVPDGRGRFNHFERGSIYWSPATGAREVRGGIRDTWSRLGWERSALAYPTTDEQATPDGRGRFNHFERGSIYWSPASGAREVRGGIRDTWSRLGWERGALGYPVTNELAVADRVGRYNDFQGGSVYWSPRTGAKELRAGILEHWRAAGAQASPLGYPTSDERRSADGVGRSNAFQNGSLHWSPSTGYVLVHSAIHQAWTADGAETGPLGYPLRENYAVPEGQAADFQNGTITWDSSTGETTIVRTTAVDPAPVG